MTQIIPSPAPVQPPLDHHLRMMDDGKLRAHVRTLYERLLGTWGAKRDKAAAAYAAAYDELQRRKTI